MTAAQKRLAVADTVFVAAWLLMNFFWMWDVYAVALPLVSLMLLAACATLWCSERTVPSMCVSASNLTWATMDAFWTLADADVLASGRILASVFFLITLCLAGTALWTAVSTGRSAEIADRLRRVSSYFLQK